MRMKPLVAAAALLIASGAQAMDYSFGDVTGAQVNDVNSVAVGGFIDNLFFSIISPSIGTGVLSDVFVNAPSMPNFDITGLSANLWVDLGSIGTVDAADTLLVPLGSGDYIQSSGPLATGNYYFQLTGTGAGALGGQYFYNAAAVPVPEPASWAMLLVGVGLVGLQLLRRDKTKNLVISV